MTRLYDTGAPMYRRILEPLLETIKRETCRWVRKRHSAPGSQTGSELGPAPGVIRILEVACGTGAQARMLAEAGFNVTAVDLSMGMLRQALSIDTHPIGLVRADGTRLPFRENTFDAVVLQLVLHELFDTQRLAVAQEIRRVTRRSGTFFFVDFLHPRRVSLSGLLLTAVERLAGHAHYHNGRQFIAQGGVTVFVEKMGLIVVKTRPFYQGRIGLVQARRKGSMA